MTSLPVSEIEQIIKYTLIILSDGIPRKGNEVANLLGQFGIHADKKSVNHALYFHGKPEITYDEQTFSYRVIALPYAVDAANGTITLKSDDDRTMTDSSEHEHNWLDAESLILRNMFVRIPLDSTSVSSLAECRDFRVGKVVSVTGNECEVKLIPGRNDF